MLLDKVGFVPLGGPPVRLSLSRYSHCSHAFSRFSDAPEVMDVEPIGGHTALILSRVLELLFALVWSAAGSQP